MNNKSSNELIQLITKGYFEQVQVKLTNDQFEFLNNPDDECRTPIILCGLIEDVNWSVSLIRQLIINGASLKRRDNNRMNIFHYCCLLEKFDLLIVLLESLDFDINCKDVYGNTPLLYAISTNNNNIIDVLIDYYKKYNINIDLCNNCGINAFMQACICENVELIEKLRQFDIDETICDINGKSAREYREEFYSKSQFMKQLKENRRQSRNVRFDDLKLIKELQEKNKELINQNNDKESSNSSDQNIQIVKDFLSRYKPIKLNQKDIIRPRFMLRCRSTNLDNDRLMKFRPKTAAVLNSSERRKLNDWYSLMRPICISLEQQMSPSFRYFVSKREADPSPESIRQNSRRSSVFSGKNGRRQSIHQRSRRESVCDTITESGPDRTLSRWASMATNTSSGAGSRPGTASSTNNSQWIATSGASATRHSKKKLDQIVSAKMLVADKTKARVGVHAT